MASVCPNCKARLSCGCQQRSASNGTRCCSNCIGAYEKSIGNNPVQRPVPPPQVGNPVPMVPQGPPNIQIRKIDIFTHR